MHHETAFHVGAYNIYNIGPTPNTAFNVNISIVRTETRPRWSSSHPVGYYWFGCPSSPHDFPLPTCQYCRKWETLRHRASEWDNGSWVWPQVWPQVWPLVLLRPIACGFCDCSFTLPNCFHLCVRICLGSVYKQPAVLICNLALSFCQVLLGFARNPVRLYYLPASSIQNEDTGVGYCRFGYPSSPHDSLYHLPKLSEIGNTPPVAHYTILGLGGRAFPISDNFGRW